MEIFEVMDVIYFHYFYTVQNFFGQALQSKISKNTEKGQKEPTNEPTVIKETVIYSPPFIP